MKIPLFPLDLVLFPGIPLRLHIFEERYKEMMTECIERQQEFGVVRAQNEGLAIAGCMAAVTQVTNRYPDGRLDIVCEGRSRFEIEQLDDSRSFLQAEVDYFEDEVADSTREERTACLALHVEVLALAGLGLGHYALDTDTSLSFQLAAELPVDLGFKQRLLVCRSDRERTAMLEMFYQEILPKLRMDAVKRPSSSNNGHGRVM